MAQLLERLAGVEGLLFCDTTDSGNNAAEPQWGWLCLSKTLTWCLVLVQPRKTGFHQTSNNPPHKWQLLSSGDS